MSSAPAAPLLLSLVDVEKRYAAPGGGEAAIVLSGIRLDVSAGESIAIVGPSGSGKSTLLHLIGALDRPSAGRVLLDGRDLSELDEEARAEVRRRDVGFVFQAHHLLPQCTALENVLLPALAGPGRPAIAAARARAVELLSRVGLGHRASHRPAQLSGGERQRVAVARALLGRPRLLIADEPTGALDRAAAESLGDLLVELNRNDGVTLVLATHAEPLASRMKRVLVLEAGRLRPRLHAGDA